MIFASEEPLPPRTLLRLLFEDENKGKKGNDNGVPEDRTLFNQSESQTEAESGAEENETDVKEVTEVGEEKADSEPAVEEERAEEEEMSEKVGQKELRGIIAELNEEYETGRRAFRIVEIAGGFQFATTKEFGEFVGLLSKERSRRRLSPASLETLSIVAYRQPVTKPEVEAIRGVNCDQVLLSLLERNLIAITGRSDAVGKPLLYGTTEDFLRAFGLNSLSDLPKLRELEELMEDDAYLASRPEGAVAEVTQELLELDEENKGDDRENGDQGDGERGELIEAEGPQEEEASVEMEKIEVEHAGSDEENVEDALPNIEEKSETEEAVESVEITDPEGVHEHGEGETETVEERS